MTLKVGAIADDFTGATDLALLIRKAGYSVIQTVGVPGEGVALPEAEAVVVALKSRTNPSDEAVKDSLAAFTFLSQQGMAQCFFKYCSTFDSTSEGNIGPVADALMAATGCELAVACPSFPENGRTVYRGHLFVNDQLLSESPLRNHPLTPMTDANLVRVLDAQTEHGVGLASCDVVDRGADALGERFTDLMGSGYRYAVVDAVNDRQLDVIGEAVVDHPLVTGGSALGASLVRARLAREGREAGEALAVAVPDGKSVVLAGSCSEATLGQIAFASKTLAARKLDIDEILAGGFDPAAMAEWAVGQPAPALLYASESAEQRNGRETALSAVEVGERIEAALAALVPELVARGVRRFVVAGGETSGAVVKSLAPDYLWIGEQIDPGVPWTVTGGDAPVGAALKSGNFGGEDFFLKALRLVGEDV